MSSHGMARKDGRNRPCDRRQEGGVLGPWHLISMSSHGMASDEHVQPWHGMASTSSHGMARSHENVQRQRALPACAINGNGQPCHGQPCHYQPCHGMTSRGMISRAFFENCEVRPGSESSPCAGPTACLKHRIRGALNRVCVVCVPDPLLAWLLSDRIRGALKSASLIGLNRPPWPPPCRFAGLIRCHFETFGSVEDVTMDPDDPEAWCALRERESREIMWITERDGIVRTE
jgi:hypothetical protein